MSKPTLEKYYQPVPFEEYEEDNKRFAVRQDCGIRFDKIKQNYGDFKGKSLIDIGCANGYFMFRFIKEGGRVAYGLDNDADFTNFIFSIAHIKRLNVYCMSELKQLPQDNYDIGIYLDLHYHAPESDEYIEFLKEHCDVLFTATSGSTRNNKRYKELLDSKFDCVNPLHQGYAGRILYKCTQSHKQ